MRVRGNFQHTCHTSIRSHPSTPLRLILPWRVLKQKQNHLRLGRGKNHLLFEYIITMDAARGHQLLMQLIDESDGEQEEESDIDLASVSNM